MARENRDYKRKAGFRDACLIIIAAEGVSTERRYFDCIHERLPNQVKSRVKIEVAPQTGNGRSAPRDVIDALDCYRKTKKTLASDAYFIAIDRDPQSWSEQQISEAATLCAQKNYVLALSNPCFEIWLLLHHKCLTEYSAAEIEEFMRSPQSLKAALRAVLGQYNHANLDVERFWPQTNTAIDRALATDTNADARWIEHCGTRVYKILQKIFAS